MDAPGWIITTPDLIVAHAPEYYGSPTLKWIYAGQSMLMDRKVKHMINELCTGNIYAAVLADW